MDQTTMALLAGAFIGLMVAIPVMTLVVIVWVGKPPKDGKR